MSAPFQRGDRVRVRLNTSYRHYLNGLEGTVYAVSNHAVVVELESDPADIQRNINPNNTPTPRRMGIPRRQFIPAELELIDGTSDC